MSAELKALELDKVLLSLAHPERGVVLWARYVDNTYISIVDVPPHLHTYLVMSLELFLSALDKLPLKWRKPLEGYVTWYEVSIHMVGNAPTLLMKGVK